MYGIHRITHFRFSPIHGTEQFMRTKHANMAAPKVFLRTFLEEKFCLLLFQKCTVFRFDISREVSLTGSKYICKFSDQSTPPIQHKHTKKVQSNTQAHTGETAPTTISMHTAASTT